MDLYLKITSAVLVSVVICLILAKNGAETGMLVSTAVCSMVLIAAVTFLQPVVDFCFRLQNLGNLDDQILRILLKAVGIGVLSQISSLICQDAGNQTLSKTLQVVATAVMIWLSLPLFEELISLIESVLGAA